MEPYKYKVTMKKYGSDDKVVKYELYYTDDVDDNPRREWCLIGYCRTKPKAISTAKRNSKTYHEVEIRGYDENYDIIFHEYYQNGKLHDKML